MINNLEVLGVYEMSAQEVREVEGGHPVVWIIVACIWLYSQSAY